jgi:hypothetical protein
VKVVVVYEAGLANVRAIAEAIGDGLNDGNEVTVLSAARARPELVAGAGLVVVGGAEGPGLLHWFSTLVRPCGVRVRAAAFDARSAGPAAFSGRASVDIRRRLAGLGFSVIDVPHSFLETANHEVAPGEADRAFLWGQQLAGQIGGVALTAVLVD